MFKIYKVTTETDKTEGRGGLTTVGHFLSGVDAEKVSKDLRFCNFYGRPDGRLWPIEVFQSFEEFEGQRVETEEYKTYLRLKEKYGERSVR